MGLQLSSTFVDHVVGGINALLPLLPNALFDLLVGILAIRLLIRMARLLMKATSVPTGLRYVLTSIIETFLWIALVIVLLRDLGLGGIVLFFTGSLAALGLAMAVGGGTLLSDIIAGIFLAQDRDFNVGDEVIVGEQPDRVQGMIESMDARRIRIRDDKGILHVLPNSLVERKEWIVLRRRHEVNALVKATKTAKKLAADAREKRAAMVRRRREARKNDQ
jgi:moderate conductance mechanosensitive channel